MTGNAMCGRCAREYVREFVVELGLREEQDRSRVWKG